MALQQLACCGPGMLNAFLTTVWQASRDGMVLVRELPASSADVWEYAYMMRRSHLIAVADWQVQQPGQSRLRGGRGRGPGGDQGADVHHGAADAAAARRAQAQRSTQPAIW